MPELISNDYKRPLLSSTQLISLIMANPWLNQWPGSSGCTGLAAEDDFCVLTIGYDSKRTTDYDLSQIKLRLTTECKMPEQQVRFVDHQTKIA